MSLNSHRITLSEGKLVTIGVVGGITTLILFFVIMSEGLVRHVPITWQEKIQTTIAFKTIGGELKVIGIIGNSGINPTLLMRTKDFAMVLTVINQDNVPHMLYIDGLGINSKILKAG